MRQVQSSSRTDGRDGERCCTPERNSSPQPLIAVASAKAGCAHIANLRSECDLLASELGACGAGARFTRQQQAFGTSDPWEQQHPVAEHEAESFVASLQRLASASSPKPLTAIDVANNSGRVAFNLQGRERIKSLVEQLYLPPAA